MVVSDIRAVTVATLYVAMCHRNCKCFALYELYKLCLHFACMHVQHMDSEARCNVMLAMQGLLVMLIPPTQVVHVM